MRSSSALAALAALLFAPTLLAAPAPAPAPAPSTDLTTPLAVTSNALALTRVKRSKSSSGSTSVAASRIKKYGSHKLRDIEVEEEWAVTIKFGGASKLVILDTGSADTWLAQTGFQCVNATGAPLAEKACNFGPLYKGSFLQTGGLIANVRRAMVLFGRGFSAHVCFHGNQQS